MPKTRPASWEWNGTTFRYSEEFVSYPPDYPHPRFAVPVHRPWPGQTEAQQAHARRENEEQASRHSVLLSLMQEAAWVLGYGRNCPVPRCRRNNRCVGRRNQFDWLGFPHGPLAPPCLPDALAFERCRIHTRTIVNAIGRAAGFSEADLLREEPLPEFLDYDPDPRLPETHEEPQPPIRRMIRGF